MRVRFLGSGDAFGDGGRFQACIVIDGGGQRLLLDCGATSLTAMKRSAVDPAAIDAIVVSHFHGDHDGGISFFLLDAQFTRRSAPLAIAGPAGIEARVSAGLEAAFPGSTAAERRFPLSFHELADGATRWIGAFSITALAARHTPGTAAVGLRVAVAANALGYSGDGEWSDALPRLAAGTDLFICEAYSFEKRIPYHLDYRTLAAHREELDTRRLVLTHPGPETLARLTELREELARDEQSIEL